MSFSHILSKSLYAVFIRDWLAVFPRDQFLFLRMEDYLGRRLDTIQKLVTFFDSGTVTAAMLEYML